MEIHIPSGMPGVPSKAILLWPFVFNQGTYAQLSGYFLCDGSNGTPDMRNYIPRGTPIAGTVGATAGGVTHTHVLTTANVQACGSGVTVVTSVAAGSSLPFVRNLEFIQRV